MSGESRTENESVTMENVARDDQVREPSLDVEKVPREAQECERERYYPRGS